MTAARIGLLALIPAAYLIGSIPFGLIVGLSKGIDPRKAGSGNIGATNVGRLLGGRFFALVFSLDFLKGLLPTLGAGGILHFAISNPQHTAPAASHSPMDYALWLSVGFAAIVGHMFSVFIGFKGGKGVATSIGVVLGVFPYYTPGAVAAVVVWGIVFKLTRYVSLGSMLGAVAFTITYIIVGLMLPAWDIFGKQWPLLAFAFLVTAMILIKHRGNIARLRTGTENRVEKKDGTHATQW